MAASVARLLPRFLEPYYAEPHEFVECSQCEAPVHIDRAVGISIGDELFCDDACLLDWVADNYDVVAKRIRD